MSRLPGIRLNSLTVDLILRIRDFDGSGLTEISIPTRVEQADHSSLAEMTFGR